MNNIRMIIALTIAWFALLSACEQPNPCRYEHPEWLYGRWKVFHIDKGGMQIGGPGFRGTEYTFKENGIVKTESPYGDTASVRYEYHCDTIIYIMDQGKEFYSIDSLTETRLRLGYVTEGIPSTVDFLRVR